MVALVTVRSVSVQIQHEVVTKEVLSNSCGVATYTLDIKEVYLGELASPKIRALADLGEWCSGPFPVEWWAENLLVEVALSDSQWWLVKSERLVEDSVGGQVILTFAEETVGSLDTKSLMTPLKRPLYWGAASGISQDILRRLVRDGIVSLNVNDPELGDIGDVYWIKGLRLDTIRQALDGQTNQLRRATD